MHTEILRGLRIRHAPLFDQPHRLKLELACKLPSLHDTPPVPSKHLTRCLRNRQQARLTDDTDAYVPRLTEDGARLWTSLSDFVDPSLLVLQEDEEGGFSSKMPE